MAYVQTALSPRETLNRLYRSLRNAYGKILKAKPGDAKADESIFRDVEEMEGYVQKLEYAFLQKIRSDSGGTDFKVLGELVKLLNDIVKSQRESVHKSHYVYRSAKHVRRIVKSKSRSAHREAKKKIKQLSTQKDKLEKEKKGKEKSFEKEKKKIEGKQKKVEEDKNKQLTKMGKKAA